MEPAAVRQRPEHRQARIEAQPAITMDHPVPDLRVVPDHLWQAVKARQDAPILKTALRKDNPMLNRRRPRYLFSGLVVCGCCGGGYSMIGATSLDCLTARNKGTCANLLTIRRNLLEASVRDGLHRHLMEPELCKDFCAAFTREVNAARMDEGATLAAPRKELERIDRELDKAIQALLDGVPGVRLKDKIGQLEARKAELTILIAEAKEPAPLLHPNMAEVYRRKVSDLAAALEHPDPRLEAADSDEVAPLHRDDVAPCFRHDVAPRGPVPHWRLRGGTPGGAASIF